MLTYEDLIEIIEVALELPQNTIKPGNESEWAENWDSLGHLAILFRLDQQLEGRCSGITELSNAYRIDEIEKILKTHGLLK